MSLYGNVKKVGSASFQFDRKYANRWQMEQNAQTDGVYAGRYVLVEYGYRFGKNDQDIVNVVNGTGVSADAEIKYVYQTVAENTYYNDADTYYIINSLGEYEEYIPQDADVWAAAVNTKKVFRKVPTINYSLINTTSGVKLENVVENQSFKQNAAIDLQKFGAIYDSTVWQKIYVNENGQGKDKYIMVAELNAMAPKLDITQDKPLSYEVYENPINNYITDGTIAGQIDDGKLTDIVRLINTEEKYAYPHFDTAVDTELTYLMHLPTQIHLEVDNNNIDYNENGFNMVYGFEEDNGPSGVAWVPKGLNDYTKLYELGMPHTDDNLRRDAGNIPLAELNTRADIDTKTLFMSFPALGNVVNDLYNLIYGKPDPQEGESLKHGVMRPYFKKFLENIDITNYVTVPNGDEAPIPVTFINGDGVETYAVVKGRLGDLVVATLNETDAIRAYQNNSLQPSELVEIRFLADNGTVYTLNSDEYRNLEKTTNEAGVQVPTTPGKFVLWDLRQSEGPDPIKIRIHVPAGDEDNLEWLSSIPGLADILANNTAGLATVLTSLFGETDPLTGTTRYYLYNDWTMGTDVNTSGPAIVNKPRVIGGYEETFSSVPSLAEADYQGRHFESAGYFWNLDPAYSNPNNNASKIPYPHTEITTSNRFSGGHYYIDFNTWQLVNYTNEVVTGN